MVAKPSASNGIPLMTKYFHCSQNNCFFLKVLRRGRAEQSILGPKARQLVSSFEG